MSVGGALESNVRYALESTSQSDPVRFVSTRLLLMATTHNEPRLDERYESQAMDAPVKATREPTPNWIRTHAIRRRMLAAADVLALVISCAALLAVGSIAPELAVGLVATLPVWVLTAKLLQLYDRDDHSLRHLTADEVAIIAIWAIVSTGLASMLVSVWSNDAVTLREATEMAVATAIAAFTLRGVARWVWRRTTSPDRAVVIGAGSLARSVRRKVELLPDIHVCLVGGESFGSISGFLSAELDFSNIDRVIVAQETVNSESFQELIRICRARRTQVSLVPPLLGQFGTAIQLDHIAELAVIEYRTADIPWSTLVVKRLVDVTLASFALIIICPLIAVTALAIKLDSRGPIFFTQVRAGLRGRPFRVFKFRTMVGDAEAQLAHHIRFEELEQPMFKFEHDPRVTRVGRVLRRTSLDEVPQLVNVIVGQMSLVGPRPEQVELVALYPPDHLFRLSVKPGVTGPMQINGRGKLTFDERLAVERDYIENLSLGRDVGILLSTVPVVLNGRGAF